MSTRIMAIDTATEACSVALWDDGKIYSHYEICPREHTQRILPIVQQVLTESGLSLNDLNALAFGQGPGSFTGVRIGIGIAQGLALGADLPLIGISTLKAMAQGAYRLAGATRVLSAIDARMGEVYWGAYTLNAESEWLCTQGESVLLPQHAKLRMTELQGVWYSVGTGWQTYSDMSEDAEIKVIDAGLLLPDAIDMLPLALASWQKGEIVAVEDAQPVYLRNEVTWKKLPGRE